MGLTSGLHARVGRRATRGAVAREPEHLVLRVLVRLPVFVVVIIAVAVEAPMLVVRCRRRYDSEFAILVLTSAHANNKKKAMKEEWNV